jgi:hypothetical protein
MSTFTFEAILKRPEGVGTWTYLDIPLEVSAAFGAKGQVKVKGSINGQPLRSSVMPHGDGSHYLVVNKAIHDAIGAVQGDLVQVVIELDHDDRSLTLPVDLVRALELKPQAKEAFARLSYSHQKEYLEWIEGAKKGATRQARIEKALDMLVQGQCPKGKRTQKGQTLPG